MQDPDIKKILGDITRLSKDQEDQRRELLKIVAELDRVKRENEQLNREITAFKQLKQSVNTLNSKVKSIESKIR